MAVNSGGQIKVLGLNGIVGQMTRHCCLSAHGHTLLPQKNITAPLPSLSPSSLPPPPPPLISPPFPFEATAFCL